MKKKIPVPCKHPTKHIRADCFGYVCQRCGKDIPYDTLVGLLCARAPSKWTKYYTALDEERKRECKKIGYIFPE